jgi:trans-2,3-dihydro-3-hydroxyanthranilate isomerase
VPTLSFALVDVFAVTPLSGNPLAVIPNADPIPEAVMPRIAQEFNQAETTFVLSSAEPRATRRLRSFTARGDEVTGAGHNALGAWWWLAQSGRVATGDFTQELGGGLGDLSIRRNADDTLQVAMHQGPGSIASEVPSSTLAAPLGLVTAQLTAEPARVVSTGAAHLLVAARDRAAVQAARPERSALLDVLRNARAQGCYLYATGPGDTAYARFFNPTVGLWEDAATGSAAGPLSWLLCGGRSGRLTVEQGDAIGRPSRIELRVDDGQVTLLGSAALFAEGQIHIPKQGDAR